MATTVRPGRALLRYLTVFVIATAVLTAPHVAAQTANPAAHLFASRAASRLAQVAFISGGLFVQPPHQKRMKGKKQMPLFNKYFLQTLVKQRASIRFRDGTTLNMNQRTDAVLSSPHVTYVRKGEVYQSLAPGGSHRVQTATAIAAAIGTRFDVKVVAGGTFFIVVKGVLRVRNSLGQQIVKTNQQSIVVPKQPPGPPQPVDATKATTWSNGIPTPDLGENIALDANGGKVVDFSSQYTGASQGDIWYAYHLIDGRLDLGWESASGKTTNQWVKILLAGNKVSQIAKVLIDPGATQGDPVSSDLKDFEIRVSTTGKADADFTTVYTGTCQQQHKLQTFQFSKPVAAKYVELFAVDNYGSPDWVGAAELETVTPAH
jgi:hypothetical protein